MLKKFNEMESNKKITIVVAIAVLLIIAILCFAYFRNQNSSFSSLKVDRKKALVYTSESKKNSIFYRNVPYLNIKDNYAKEVNEDINLFVSDFIDNEKAIVSYEYNINGEVLSLIIKAVDYDIENVPEVYFRSYNINLKEKSIISDEQLLSNFNITSDDVNTIIEKKFMDWYQDIVKKGYFDENECDYDCFLEYRDVDDYLEGVSYYIEKGNLIVYKPFVFYSVYGEEEYFKEKDFKFIIVKRES